MSRSLGINAVHDQFLMGTRKLRNVFLLLPSFLAPPQNLSKRAAGDELVLVLCCDGAFVLLVLADVKHPGTVCLFQRVHVLQNGWFHAGCFKATFD